MSSSSQTPDLFDVSNRTVIVTGGLGQLGHQYTLALVARGARVAVLDVSMDEQKVAVVYGASRESEQLLFVAADVTSRASLEAALEKITTHWSVPYALVNNAALDSPPSAPAEETGPFEQYPEASWD